MVDRKDLQILYYLDQDCRQSIARIAKRVHLHRNVVQYRIRKMEQEKVIRGYYTQINTIALGYLTFRIFLSISNATSAQENSLIEYFKKELRTIWFFRTQGTWDFDAILVARSLVEIEGFLQDFQVKFNSIIEEKNLAIFTQIYDLPKDYLIEKKRAYGKHVFSTLHPLRANEHEEVIIRLLGSDARMHIIDLAEKASLSVNTVKSIMRALMKKGIIVKFRVFIDTAKSGYRYYKIHMNLKQYEAKDLARIKTWFGTDARVISINTLINGEDIETELHMRSEQEMNKFMRQLKEEFGFMIKKTFIIEFTEEFIYRYLPSE